MDADALRALQAPLKARYKDDPASALVTLRARGEVGPEELSCRVWTGQGVAVAGLHPATGGDGQGLCSGDMLLEALVACTGVTLRAVATAMGLTLRGAIVTAEGDIDFRGTLGVSKEAPVGFRAIRLLIALDTDASESQQETLLRLSERYCVVYQTLAKGVDISLNYEIRQIPIVGLSPRPDEATGG